MSFLTNLFKVIWDVINKINPETRSIIILALFGYVLYSQINKSTQDIITQKTEQTNEKEKKAEEYAKNTAIEVNRHVRLIAHKDQDAFDVLLLSYHNSKSNLHGYKFLYLSCITESPKSIDTPLVGHQWTNLDYVYYVDELEKIHNQEVVNISNIDSMRYSLPKLYRLLKNSEAKSASFYVVEGKNNPIGIVVTLYKEINASNIDKDKIIMPSIQKLAILLDYDQNNK